MSRISNRGVVQLEAVSKPRLAAGKAFARVERTIQSASSRRRRDRLFPVSLIDDVSALRPDARVETRATSPCGRKRLRVSRRRGGRILEGHAQSWPGDMNSFRVPTDGGDPASGSRFEHWRHEGLLKKRVARVLSGSEALAKEANPRKPCSRFGQKTLPALDRGEKPWKSLFQQPHDADSRREAHHVPAGRRCVPRLARPAVSTDGS